MRAAFAASSLGEKVELPFAALCVCFAFFAVPGFFYRKGTQRNAKQLPVTRQSVPTAGSSSHINAGLRQQGLKLRQSNIHQP
jgi:hypothetical protein